MLSSIECNTWPLVTLGLAFYAYCKIIASRPWWKAQSIDELQLYKFLIWIQTKVQYNETGPYLRRLKRRCSEVSASCFDVGLQRRYCCHVDIHEGFFASVAAAVAASVAVIFMFDAANNLLSLSLNIHLLHHLESKRMLQILWCLLSTSKHSSVQNHRK